jgi:hypothetical protein
MIEDPEGGDEIRGADWKFAARLLEKGVSLSEVESKLLDRGLSTEQVAVLLNEFVVQSTYAEAEHLLGQGKPPAAVAAELVKRGLQQEDADRVLADIQKVRQDQESFLRHAIQRLASGRRRKTVEGELLCLGASPQIATFIVREAGRVIRSEVRKVGWRNVGIGFGAVVLGVVITLVSLAFAEHVGKWVIMVGLTVSGVVVFLRGLFQLVTGSDVE